MASSPSRDLYTTHTFKSVNPSRAAPDASVLTAPHNPVPIPTKPMSVPNSTSKKSPPPPLPPPRYIDSATNTSPHDLVHRSHESYNAGLVKSGSSLLGGSSGSAKQYAGPQKDIDLSTGSPPASGRDDSGEDVQGDQRMPDLDPVVDYNNKLRGEKQLGQRSRERSSVAYDKQVLAQLGQGRPSSPPRSADALSPSGTTEFNEQASPKSFKDFAGGPLRPLSFHERRRSDIESPRWPSSALSPSFPTVNSPLSDSDLERRTWPRPPNKHNNSDSQIQSPREGQTPNMSAEDSHLSELNINDKRPLSADETKNGHKRRAQSPSTTSIDPTLRSNEETQQRDLKPTFRPQKHEPGSLATSLGSSLSSGVQQNSYQSSMGFSAGSSATSYSSQQLPSSQPQQHQDAQPPTPQDAVAGQLVQSPSQVQSQQSMAPPPPHRRTGSSGIPRPPGVFICECCPKKPRKFDNEEELRNHELEKQYFCQFCHNRFKNKNEAERHQNSLHLRRHSWSCAALQSLEDAFHPTMNANMATAAAAHAAATQQSPNAVRFPSNSNSDTCGYCGQEFPNPADWSARIEHLNHVHKFGECNQGKKFYRADHFRQHLKHSHAGTSGRWTNMLENACMRDEPPPQPLPHLPIGIQAAATVPGMQIGQIQHYTVPQMQQLQTQTFQQMQQQNGQMQQQPPQMQPMPNSGQQTPVTPSNQQLHGQPLSAPQPAPQNFQQMPTNVPNTSLTEQQAQEAAQQATQQANHHTQPSDMPSDQPAPTPQPAEQAV